MLNYLKNTGLQALHDGIGPKACVDVEICGKPLVAGEVEQGISIGQRLQAIFAVEDIEVATANGDVLVQCRGRNVLGVSLDAKGETMFRFPCGDSLDEDETMLEACVTDSANSFVGKRCFDGTGEADMLRPSCV